jgi:hypothetical protein
MSYRAKACLSLLLEPGLRVSIRSFIGAAEQWFKVLGHAPNYFGIKGPGFSRDTISYERVRRKLESPLVEEAEYVELLEMPPGNKRFSEAPIYASLSVRHKQDAIFEVDTSLHTESSVNWIRLAQQVHSVYPFVYGYAYTLRYDMGPGHYANGIAYQVGVGGVRHEEELRGRWGRVLMAPKSNPRNQRLRQVYRLQFLSEGHLQLNIGGTSLREWIDASAEHGLLSPLVDGIWAWSIDDESVVLAANRALFAAGLLSAWDPQLAGAMTA